MNSSYRCKKKMKKKVSTKRKNVRVRQGENLEKALLDWFKRMRMNNLAISGTIFKEKTISYGQELQAKEFLGSNGWFERWEARFNVSLKTVKPEMTSSWWETHLPRTLSRFELKEIYNAIVYNI